MITSSHVVGLDDVSWLKASIEVYNDLDGVIALNSRCASDRRTGPRHLLAVTPVKTKLPFLDTDLPPDRQPSLLPYYLAP